MWWMAVALGAEAVVVREVEHLGARFSVVEVDLARARIDLVGEGSLEEAVEAARKEGRVVRAATNAGMYHADRSPVGLHVQRGVERAPVVRNARGGNFGLLPNGVFAVDGAGASVVTTPEWTATSGSTWLATQSGPMLVIDGEVHPRFDPAGTSLKLRSGVGVADAGHVVLALSLEPVRFHDFATLFRDALGCDDALFLDGTVSALWTEDGRRGMPGGRYSGVLLVTEDAPPAAPGPARTGP
ncbi:MAG: phosphodiester glycosidase family protein [Alphaproteobacteria bacterium]|nr:phosphodiester glycosidase family protein [Alphaproteobacteria bacterium]